MTRPWILTAVAIALLTGTTSPRAATAESDDAVALHPPDGDARRLVRDRVERQLASLEESIFALEASQPKVALVRRRFTVETFLLAALVPQAIAFAEQPDLAPLWRQDFRSDPSRLAGPSGWTGRNTLLGAPAVAVGGRFVVEMLEPVGGDDAVAIGGRFVVGRDSATLTATWCEPCLHPEAVDFPIVPEAFLLAWDRSHREVATLLPTALSHRESVRDRPPRLDQPEDLYDLFDGLRAMTPVRSEPSAPAPDRSGRDDREPRGRSLHVAHASDGVELQRVAVEEDPQGGDLVVTIHQPPVVCRWSSPRRYEFRGDIAGDPIGVRSIVPQGEVASLEAPVVATFRIRTGSIVGTIHRGGALLATLRWASILPHSEDEAAEATARLREPFHEALARQVEGDSSKHASGMPPPFDSRAAFDRLDALDPIGADLRRARLDLMASSQGDDAAAAERAFARHRRLVVEQSLDPSTLWRGVEAFAEALASVEAVDALRRWIDGVGAAALAVAPAESLTLMLADRIRMGRFAAAVLLASELAQRDSADAAARGWAERVLTRLLAAAADGELDESSRETSLAPAWWEPLGRARFAAFVAGQLLDCRNGSTPLQRLISHAAPDPTAP